MRTVAKLSQAAGCNFRDEPKPLVRWPFQGQPLASLGHGLLRGRKPFSRGLLTPPEEFNHVQTSIRLNKLLSSWQYGSSVEDLEAWF